MDTEYRKKLGDRRPYWKVIVSLAFSLLGTALFIGVGYKLLIYFFPFAIGWFISAIASPLVGFLEKKVKIMRKLSSALIITGVLAGLILILYFVGMKVWEEVESLAETLPDMYSDLEQGLHTIGKGLKGTSSMLPEGIQNGLDTMFDNLDKEAGNIVARFSTPTFTAAGRFAKKIPSVFIGTIVTIISAYFFIAEREEVLSWAKKVTPYPIVSRMTMVCDNLKYAIGGYFRAQFKIMAVIFVILLTGFMAMGIHYNFLLAFLIAFLDFLPFFGTGTALIPWAVYKFLMGDYRMVVGLSILYAVTQLVRQLIQPKLVGDSIGMKPLPTLIFIYLGYKVGGIFGMIFAVPVGMIIINLYKAGAFDYILDDVKILMEGILKLRDRENG